MQPGQHRITARVILCKPNGEVFLLLTHFDPEVGLPPRWITPGGGIDPDEYSGFAFGFGIDRMAKERHGVADLRDMYANDLRFVRQF